MAGDWIKIEASTPEKPEIMRLARIIGLSPAAAFGYMVKFWIWLDRNSVDGVVDDVLSTDVDQLLSLPGFAQAMNDIGWLTFDDQKRRIKVPDFDRHNGESAKKRALKSRSQEKWRRNNVDRQLSTTQSTREEKRRSIKPSPASREILNGAFVSFWTAYPKKKSKGDAEKAWVKIKPDEALAGEIVAAVERLRTSPDWIKDGGQFIPHPATWLNRKGWEDEPDVQTAPEQRKLVV